MLFNSYEFIFLFLPATVVGFFLLGRADRRAAAAFLTLASLFFYGWWNPKYVLLLMASIAVNYTCGTVTTRAASLGATGWAAVVAGTGITLNLALLAYYKYANFFVENWQAVTGASWELGTIVLPLGISFFTFTQIAFLVDAYQGKAREYNPVHYGLFVTYFPHLIAGPILHHREMMPQFEKPETYRLSAENLAVGLTIFSIGLFKKTVLADGIAPYASLSFGAASSGESLTLFSAWGGALAYTLQLYFDFSGYCDMAIGLSRLFGIALPLNFNSPYKATSIIDFWRRWHMTLSRFLREYLYVPLGGSRRGVTRRYVNLLLTMLLGGLWHGAGWTFVAWGALHGSYLAINHAWRGLCERMNLEISGSRAYRFGSLLLTFIAVVAGWVFFRAADVDTAVRMLRGMIGLNGIYLPAAFEPVFGGAKPVLERLGVTFTLGGGAAFVKMYVWIVLLLPVVFLFPNTQELLARFRPALNEVAPNASWRLLWQPTPLWALYSATLAACGLLSLTRVSEFLYFQF